MNTPATIIIAILVFGFLILIHELGHYLTARLFKVRIEEFSIGMGPRLLWFTSKKTGIKYSLAMLPLGGFVAMPGENGEDEEYKDDPNTFGKKPAWQRFLVTAAGAFVNLLFGFIFMIVLTSISDFGYTTVSKFKTEEYMQNMYAESGELSYSSSQNAGLLPGDEIISIEGKRVRIADEVNYEIMRRGNNPVDVVIRRGGELMTLEDVTFSKLDQMGQTVGVMDFWVENEISKNPFNVLSYSVAKSVLIVRMSAESIIDLITGRFTFAAISGPVGISSTLGNAAAGGIRTFLNTVLLISISLGFMNLLPIPALDGGRLVTIFIEMVTKKKLPPKVEGIINGVGLAALLGLSFIVMIKDVIQLIIN